MAENNGTADFSSGLFNAGSILQGFYEWEPASDDVAGQQLKNTFMSDTATNILNNEMSKDLASFNNSLATDHCWFISYFFSFLNSFVNCIRIVSINISYCMPTIRFKSFSGVVRIPTFNMSINRNTVVIPKSN